MTLDEIKIKRGNSYEHVKQKQVNYANNVDICVLL